MFCKLAACYLLFAADSGLWLFAARIAVVSGVCPGALGGWGADIFIMLCQDFNMPSSVDTFISVTNSLFFESSSNNCAYKVKRLWGRIWFERVC